jgi:hypothetical protein
VYRTWVAIGLAGLLSGVALVSLFVGFGSPVFLVVAAVSATGGVLAYRYARERMLRSVYAGVETRGQGTRRADGPATDEGTETGTETGDRTAPDPGEHAEDGGQGTQATDGGESAADYDEWTWADSDPDDPFWSDDPDDWDDPWGWEATDPEDATTGGWWQGAGRDAGSRRWSGRTGGDREDGSRGGSTAAGDRDDRPTVEAAYEVLGLEPEADLDAVREAYRERAKETHPDLGGDPEAFIRVREAYERLRDHLRGDAS